ncbi:hypothetical protein D5S17_11030 [Pseudonocardiaceae bacterium YIM PH 21723]|nr:hypothetical protein D5S17_11030 [Pseudonocardiaceae bacterium YIM PH 21723]
MAHSVVEQHLAEVIELARRYPVRRLDLFGSATSNDFDLEHSDVDILVEFDYPAEFDPDFDYVGNYFDLKDGLEEIFGRSVDLVSIAAIKNPYFLREVMATREQLYAA